MDRQRRTDPVAFTLARFESFGFLPVEASKSPCVCIVEACQTICNSTVIYEWMWRPVMRSHGGHSEHLIIKLSFSYNSEIKRFWNQVYMDIFSCFGMWSLCPKFVCTFQVNSAYCGLLLIYSLVGLKLLYKLTY
jgi:hypothetical protein